MLTGEALPRTKSKTDAVFAGTINQLGTLTLQVQTDPQKTVLAQIIEAVEQAQNSKIPAQRMADKLAAIFVPLVLVISLLTAFYWSTQGSPAIAINTALTVLLIACPCALGLATPIVSYIAIQKAAQRGIIIRDAAALEKAEKIDTVLLDKTGTITEGAPKIVGIHWQHFLLFQARVLEKVLLALEAESQHPIAKTFTKAFNPNTK
jgi:P-type E1-E2 ATPase